MSIRSAELQLGFWIFTLTFLSSPKYKEDLLKFREKRSRTAEVSEAFMPDDASIGDTASNWGVVNVDKSEVSGELSNTSVKGSHQYCELCLC